MADGVRDILRPQERRRTVVLPRWRARYRLTPWWGRVLVIWLLSRVLTSAMVLTLARVQGPNPWTGAHPSYVDYANIWDGRWYNIVAVAGYPSVLPVTPDGHIAENAWAFMPGYPAVVRLIMFATGLQWNSVAVFVSLAFSLATALVFYRLMRRVLPGETAMFAVVLFCVAPLSPILQFGYAESMHLFFLTVALYLLLERRYVLLFPVITVMALTRPTGLAFALALVLHVGYRWFTRHTDPYPPGERMLSAGVAVFSALMGLAWPAVAWAVTGQPGAYTDTELAWRAPYIGYQELVPFSAWFQGGVWWLGMPLGILAVIALVLAFGMFLFTPAVKRLGIDLRAWVVSYAIYLLAVFFPQSSTFRLLMPLFPLLGAVAAPRSRIYRVVVVLVSIAAQWGWLLICWGVDGADWTPP
ncbi:mannosyltransferase family protein [Cryobacterium tepidiphilum]|uniref:Glycosyltransferase RgtA/B/C/D-like domain-containing protein n=1 Tax=Cryobacterium tepidiphilum TaxID=2486026 RepID=A0A3M8LEC7_9MICO|nr:mannosyltransferase family protein [Cryobacterium tepidiphilum]RNE63836.1 hypothetical protein EEJ31_06325 [Cryobacterium tepidiphilum]